MTRHDILAHMRDRIASGNPFWGIAASKHGDAAKARTAGASWITVTHAAGLDPNVPASAIGLLPYADANTAVLERTALATEEADFPVLAGVFAPDQFRPTAFLLEQLRDGGFHGVQNYPSVGLADGRFRTLFQDAGMEYDCEIAMAEMARAMDFFVSAIVFTPEHARAMARAGADMVVFHPGLTEEGEFCGWTPDVRQRFEDAVAAARRHAEHIIVARLSFERVSFESDGYGIQYDHGIEENRHATGIS